MQHYLIIVFLLLLGCINSIKDIDSTYLDLISNDSGKGVEIKYYLEGNLEFQLFASEMEVLNGNKNIFNNGVMVYVFNNHFDTIATISSNVAIHNKENDLIEIKNNVVLSNNKNEQLITERLFWNNETKKIYTDVKDSVTLNTEKQIIMGFGFTADQYFSTYSLSNITGTIYL